MRRGIEEWERVAVDGQLDLWTLTREEVEHCRGFCWTCVKRWCPWNETPPLRHSARWKLECHEQKPLKSTRAATTRGLSRFIGWC